MILLQRYLAKAQWFSLAILFIGVSLVQLQTSSSSKKASGDENPVVGIENLDFLNKTLGFVAACVACGISGFAGVFFEKILKGSAPVSIWMRNVQMGVFSIPASFAAVLIQVLPIFCHLYFIGWVRNNGKRLSIWIRFCRLGNSVSCFFKSQNPMSNFIINN